MYTTICYTIRTRTPTVAKAKISLELLRQSGCKGLESIGMHRYMFLYWSYLQP